MAYDSNSQPDCNGILGDRRLRDNNEISTSNSVYRSDIPKLSLQDEAHVDNLIWYGVDSPNLPCDELVTAPSPAFSVTTAITPHLFNFNLVPEPLLRSVNDSYSLAQSSWSRYPAPLNGTTEPSWLSLSPNEQTQSTFATFPLSTEYSPDITLSPGGDPTASPTPLFVSPKATPGPSLQHEGSLTGPTSETQVPPELLGKWQVDGYSPPPQVQAGEPVAHATSSSTSSARDPRCICPGPIEDWTRHWREFCPFNLDRKHPCTNGCGRVFTRKCNMKRHIEEGVCPLSTPEV